MKTQAKRRMTRAEAKADIKQKKEAVEQSEYADFNDVTFTMETANGLTVTKDVNLFIQSQYKQAGYEDFAGKYDIWSMGKEYGSFLLWDERSNKQLPDGRWNWDNLFKDEPYLSTWYSQSGTIPSIPIASNRLFAQRKYDYLDAEKSKESYRAFLDDIELNQLPKIQRMTSLDGYQKVLLRKAGLIIAKMQEHDEHAKAVLKVFYFEVKESINKEAKTPERYKALSVLYDTMRHAFNVSFLKYCFSTINFREILSDKTIIPYINDVILESAVNGMKYLVDEKEPFVIALADIYEKLVHTEYAINDILRGEDEATPLPLTSYNDRVIDYAKEMYSLTNSHTAEIFWQKYARLRDEHPGWITDGKKKYSKFRNAILKVHPDISVSIPTINDWICKYEKALESYNAMFKK